MKCIIFYHCLFKRIKTVKRNKRAIRGGLVKTCTTARTNTVDSFGGTRFTTALDLEFAGVVVVVGLPLALHQHQY